jgi:hypothetical protein
MGHKASLEFLKKRKSLASTGIRAPDRPFRSLIATLTPKAFYTTNSHEKIHKKAIRFKSFEKQSRTLEVIRNMFIDFYRHA